MSLGSRWVNGREMRRGYTTGTCAAAAAKAAVEILFTGKILEEVDVTLPAGNSLKLKLYDIELQNGAITCAVKKDAGDDPDITDGILIYAKALKTKEGIVVKGGKGVGRVTKRGLPVEVGSPAINPVPYKMILDETAKVLPWGEGVEITISVPEGEIIAQKTLNSRIGIEGGLSILGTTGIVEPMSEEAWKESLYLELKVLATRNTKKVILIFGNYGEDFVCKNLGLTDKPLIKMSNFVGYALKAAAELGFTKILLVGDLGKLIKVSAGIFQTHSSVADARMEIMAAYAGALGAEPQLIRRILELNTTTAAIELLENENIVGAYDFIASRVSRKAEEHIKDKAGIGTVLFANSKGLLAVDQYGRELLEEFNHE